MEELGPKRYPRRRHLRIRLLEFAHSLTDAGPKLGLPSQGTKSRSPKRWRYKLRWGAVHGQAESSATCGLTRRRRVQDS